MSLVTCGHRARAAEKRAEPSGVPCARHGKREMAHLEMRARAVTWPFRRAGPERKTNSCRRDRPMR